MPNKELVNLLCASLKDHSLIGLDQDEPGCAVLSRVISLNSQELSRADHQFSSSLDKVMRLLSEPDAAEQIRSELLTTEEAYNTARVALLEGVLAIIGPLLEGRES